MRRLVLAAPWLALAAAFCVPAAANVIELGPYVVVPKGPPLSIPPPPTPRTDHYSTSIGYRAIGPAFGAMNGVPQDAGEEKSLYVGIPTNPPEPEKPKYNKYPLFWVIPKDPGGGVVASFLVPFAAIMADGPIVTPPLPGPFLEPIPDNVTALSGSLVMPNGLEYFSTITTLTNLNQVPTSLPSPIGPIGLEWRLDESFSADQFAPDFVGRYELFITYVPISSIPEPAGLMALALGLGGLVGRARRAAA